MSNQCKFKSQYGVEYVCPYPEFKNDFCVFHIPKPSWDELKEMTKSEKTENRNVELLFKQEIDKLI